VNASKLQVFVHGLSSKRSTPFDVASLFFKWLPPACTKMPTLMLASASLATTVSLVPDTPYSVSFKILWRNPSLKKRLQADSPYPTEYPRRKMDLI
jgi:hypothetical protein